MQAMVWDVFCRVIDNFGDIGVCWRLAADLGARGQTVRLWVDDTSALDWMAPHGASGVSVHAWHEAAGAPQAGDVVIEAFGCELPAPFIERMAQAARAPAWINLEYLSAEPYVERSHGLLSPQRNGLRKWFFYPGFTAATGGLIREPGLVERLDATDRSQWLAVRGIDAQPHERVITVFCYANPALPDLIDALETEPTLLLLAGGAAQQQARQALGVPMRRKALRAQPIGLLSQAEFDTLLRCSDLNVVRGEDSFVRAQWAGRPFVWQIYPQDDGAHAAKLDAFLSRHLQLAAPDLASDVRRLFLKFNGLAPVGEMALPDLAAWHGHTAHWRADLARQNDLTGQLLRFVTERRGEAE